MTLAEAQIAASPVARPDNLRPGVVWFGDLDLPTGGQHISAPFPWFGGKRRVASLVWRAFGPCVNYVEPFFGSGAVLLARPPDMLPDNARETVNDLDGHVANFWRSVKLSPEAVAEWADWPVNENDLTARNAWLAAQRTHLKTALNADPEWHDPKIAGWWVWGISQWIGSGFADKSHRLKLPDVDGAGDRGLAKAARGQIPYIDGDNQRRGTVARAAKKKLPEINGHNSGRGVHGASARANLTAVMAALSHRLRFTRVASGDWTRVLTNTPLRPTVGDRGNNAFTGVFLDPPYETSHDVYAEGHNIGADVRAWCIEHGATPYYRIALCGYEGEHNALEDHGWTCVAWKAKGGYATDDTNSFSERVWLSPACLPLAQQRTLF